MITSFQFISLNGFFAGPDGDISWSHRPDPEHTAHATNGLSSGNILLFGRVTYEMMASHWPSALAKKIDPVVADGMNSAEKIVFSRRLKKADWNNTRVVSQDIVKEAKSLKRDATILGSGSILTQLSDAHLVDEYQILLNAIALGDGVPLFKGLKEPKRFRLKAHRAFDNGNLLLTYAPA